MGMSIELLPSGQLVPGWIQGNRGPIWKGRPAGWADVACGGKGAQTGSIMELQQRESPLPGWFCKVQSRCRDSSSYEVVDLIVTTAPGVWAR